ncbi:MAG: hypothetical protein M0P71_12550 [Melioribacteraceae bacterium]|nr:hypothetical protein [Melioribacteraceae bacterium]
MEEEKLIFPLTERIMKDLQTTEFNLPIHANLEMVKEQLINKIREMMVKDYDRFMNNLYRMDISEGKVIDVMNSKEKQLIPDQLADLIIERQMQRVKTRLLYKEGKL